MTKYCNNCGLKFPQHPAKFVDCPHCPAEEGQRCERPSGHKCSIHRDRDLLALAKGIAPPCPEAKNPLMPWEAAEKLDVECEVDDPLDPESYQFGDDLSAIERYLEANPDDQQDMTNDTNDNADDDAEQDEEITWEEAQEMVREFADGEVRAITPMAGEMVVLYDEGKYGPQGRDSPPNVELITKADSIWDTWTDDGSMSFRSILEQYELEVLEEVDLSSSSSEAESKAYVGIPKDQIRTETVEAR